MTKMTGRPAIGRPVEKITAADAVLSIQRIANEAQAMPTQVRRRRAAADCDEPLGDGRRDLLKSDRRGDRWTSDRTLHVEVGRRTAWLHRGRVVRLLDQVSIDQRVWDHRRRLLMVLMDRVDDPLVQAEHFESRFCTVEAVDR